ncbi:MAG: hypothetical protein QXS54_10070 [Candidatus Methanomethylicaceae archaeon]
MSRQKHKIALQHGERLPSFSNLEDAERYWYAFRDKHLAHLLEIARQSPDFHPDYTPESLKQLEHWYFSLCETDSFHFTGTTRETFEVCMAMYFGETVVRNTRARWIVQEYFLASGKYELGLQKDSMTIALYRYTEPFLAISNKRKQSLFRAYKKYFSRDVSSDLDLDKEIRRLLRQKKKLSAILLCQKHKMCTLEEARQYVEALR